MIEVSKPYALHDAHAHISDRLGFGKLYVPGVLPSLSLAVVRSTGVTNFKKL